jgi:hypothetical protein
VAWAVSGTGSVAAQNTKTSSSSYTSGAVTAASGEVILLAITYDNTSATAPSVSSISKPGGETNSWARLHQANSSSSSSAGGCRTEMWGIVATTAWSAFTPVVTLSGAVAAKASCGAVLTGGTLTQATGSPYAATSTAGNPSIDWTDPSGEVGWGLFAAGHENNTTPTYSGSYTSLGSSNTSGGGAASNVGIRLAYQAFSGSGGAAAASPTCSGDSNQVGVLLLEAAGGTVVTLGKPTETDTALAVSKAKARTTGLPTTTNAAQAITRVKRKTLGAVTSTSAAQTITRVKVRILGTLAAPSTALAVTRLKARTLGHVTEADATSPLARLKARILGRPIETDTALAITQPAGGTLGRPVEVDTAHAITPVKTRVLGTVAETDTAVTVLRVKTVPLGHVSTTTAVLPMAHVKVRTVGAVATTDVALPIARRKVQGLGTVTETDTAHLVTVGGVAPNYPHPAASFGTTGSGARTPQTAGAGASTGRTGGAGVRRAGSASISSGTSGAELP